MLEEEKNIKEIEENMIRLHQHRNKNDKVIKIRFLNYNLFFTVSMIIYEYYSMLGCNKLNNLSLIFF